MTQYKGHEQAEMFEHAPCSRCGGSGNHSYCSSWGHTCFKCVFRKGVPGTGRQLTKRGAAAAAYYETLRPRKAVRDLVPGDQIIELLVELTGGDIAHRYVAARVKEIKPTTSSTTSGHIENGVRHEIKRGSETGAVDVVTDKLTLACADPDHMCILVWPDILAKGVALKAAQEYQGTLTKQGTVRKTKPRAKKAPATYAGPDGRQYTIPEAEVAS
jgi:hypothetical protein